MRVEFVVGVGKDQNGKPINYVDSDFKLHKIAERIAKTLGGATVTHGRGYWEHDGRVLTEKCTVIVADAHEDEHTRNVVIGELVEYARSLLKQTAVHVTTFHSASKNTYAK